MFIGLTQQNGKLVLKLWCAQRLAFPFGEGGSPKG